MLAEAEVRSLISNIFKFDLLIVLKVTKTDKGGGIVSVNSERRSNA